MDLFAFEDLKSVGTDSEDRRGEAPAAPQEAGPAKAGSLVTPSLLITGPSAWEFLAANVDTLDLSLYVDWGESWTRLRWELERQKIVAQNTSGILFRDENTLLYPSGGKRFCQWHLQRPDMHLFLTQRPDSNSPTPNVCASLSARLLWERGPALAQQAVANWVKELGGSIAKTKVSRLDLAADFSVPGGLTSEFLKQHCVCRSRKCVFYEDDSETETAYFGAASAPIRLRIYDKTRELLLSPTKTWLPEVWGEQTYARVMRVEFQIRREALRELGIEECSDLKNIAGIWEYLALIWFSLRLPEDKNTSRRALHPFWISVQSVAKNLGESVTIVRKRFRAKPNKDRVLAQLRGLFVSLASLSGIDNFNEALDSFKDMMTGRHLDRNFYEDVQTRRVKFGVPSESIDFDPKTWETKEDV